MLVDNFQRKNNGRDRLPFCAGSDREGNLPKLLRKLPTTRGGGGGYKLYSIQLKNLQCSLKRCEICNAESIKGAADGLFITDFTPLETALQIFQLD